jgi:hypothetical protein
VVSVTDPYGRILGFLDRSRYFSTKQLLSCTHEADWTPFQTHYFFFLVVPGIEPGPPDHTFCFTCVNYTNVNLPLWTLVEGSVPV